MTLSRLFSRRFKTSCNVSNASGAVAGPLKPRSPGSWSRLSVTSAPLTGSVLPPVSCVSTVRSTVETLSPSVPVRTAEGPSVRAARAAFEAAGIGPDEIDVAQLQDTEVGHEIMHMAENGFCKDGEQEAWIRAGETEIGGRLPINTDGGLLANGEPIGASGLRQVHEICLQLRGRVVAELQPGHEAARQHQQVPQVVEVAVEDRALEARPLHDLTDAQLLVGAFLHQLHGGGDDPLPRLLAAVSGATLALGCCCRGHSGLVDTV